MSRNIIAYFQSENDAESARAGLQRFRVSNVNVDTIPEDRSKLLFFPILPLSTPRESPGASGAASYGTPIMGDDDFSEQNPQITHVLEVKVNEEDYEKAIGVLTEHEGYFESGD